MSPQERLQLLEALDAAKTPQERLVALEALDRAESKVQGQKTTQEAKGLLRGMAEDFTRGALSSGAGVYDLFGARPQGMPRPEPWPRGPLFPRTPAEPLSPVVREMLPVPENESGPRQTLRYGLEGIGGAAAMGPGVLLRAPAVASSVAAGSNIAANFAQNAAEKAFPDSKVAGPTAAILTGMAAAPVLAFGFGKFSPKTSQTAAQAELSAALPKADSPVWNQAQANLATLNAIPGLRSTTLADVFPQNSALRSLAEQVRASPGGRQLRDRLDLRQDDLATLREALLRSPSGAPGAAAPEVAARTASTASEVLDNLRSWRSTSFSGQFNRLPGGADANQAAIANAVANFRARLQANPRTNESQLYRDAADQLEQALTSPTPMVIPQPPRSSIVQRGPKGFKQVVQTPQPDLRLPQPKTNILAAADDVKQLQQQTNPLTATGGKMLNAGAVKFILKEADDILRQSNPFYGSAQDVYRQLSQSATTPATRGPLGIASGRAFKENVPVPEARLESMFRGQSDAEITRTLQLLQSQGTGMQAGRVVRPNADLPEQILQATLQTRLAAAPTDIGAAVRGGAGSARERELLTMARAAGRDPASLQGPLKASDLLQGFASPRGDSGPMLPWYSGLLRPFRTADIKLSAMSREKRYEEIAKILSDPARLPELRAAAMWNPQLRRDIATVAAVVPATQSQQPSE